MTVEVDQRIGEIIIVPSDEQQVIDVTIPEREVVTIEVPGTQGSPGKGVPAGGVSGQFLVKESDDDYDTVWVDMEDPSGAVRFDEVQNLDEGEKQQARDNIGVVNLPIPVPVQSGGTGGTTPSGARSGLGLIYASTLEAESGTATNRVMSPYGVQRALEVSDLFATKDQGAKADTALQPGAKIPVTDITTGAGTPVVVGRMGSSGAIETIALEYTAIQNTVPLRGEGGIVAVGAPTGPTHAIPLSHLEDQLSEIGPGDLSTDGLTNNTVWTFSSGNFFQMGWSSGTQGSTLVRRTAFGRIEAAPAASDTQVTTLGQVNDLLADILQRLDDLENS